MRALWLCLIASCGAAPGGVGEPELAPIPNAERPRHGHGHCHAAEEGPARCHDHFHGPEHHTDHEAEPTRPADRSR